MSRKRNSLMLAYYPIMFFKGIKSFFWRFEGHQLRVLLYHDIPPHLEGSFFKQLIWMKKKWKFITPLEFVEIIERGKPLVENSLLLTFDDGFGSNYEVAKRVLHKLKIKAIFFIVPNYMNLARSDDWRKYISENIYPGISEIKIPRQWQNMELHQVKDLIEMGHLIGSHTLSHARLSEISDHQQLTNEIVLSGIELGNLLDYEVNHFAYTFGDLNSFSPEAYRLARIAYSFVYTGLGGDNSQEKNSKLILRDVIFPEDSLLLIGAILEGGSDWYFSKKISKLKSWI